MDLIELDPFPPDALVEGAGRLSNDLSGRAESAARELLIARSACASSAPSPLPDPLLGSLPTSQVCQKSLRSHGFRSALVFAPHCRSSCATSRAPMLLNVAFSCQASESSASVSWASESMVFLGALSAAAPWRRAEAPPRFRRGRTKVCEEVSTCGTSPFTTGAKVNFLLRERRSRGGLPLPGVRLPCASACISSAVLVS